MKYLVVGGSGFIGRHVLAHVRSLGHPLVGTQWAAKDPSLTTFDLSADSIRDRVDPEFFGGGQEAVGIITAGIVPFDRCFQEKSLTRKVNVESTIRLIKDLQELGVKPVFMSSEAVYDGVTGYHDEERPRQPLCEYGRQKAEVERFIEETVPNGLVLRLDYVVGDDPQEDHLFSRWSRWITGGGPITCIQGQLFSPTYVEDVAQAIVLSCHVGLTGIYNLASPEYFSRDELARQFVHESGSETAVITKPVEEFGFLDQRPLRSYLDSTKLVKATGIRFTSMREVMRSFIQKTQGDPQTPDPAAAGHRSS